MMGASETSPLRRILLVEDSEHDRTAFDRAWKNSDVPSEITYCFRAEEVLARFDAAETSFDLVVADHSLPGMSGLELCKELIKRETRLALVILTGKGSEQLAVEALKAGVNDYVIKDPGDGYLELLPVVLNEVIRKHEDRLARERAEAALRDSEERTRKVLAASPAPIAVFDLEGKVIYLNQAFTRIFGWTAEEAAGKKIACVPEENRRETQVIIDRVLAGEDFAGTATCRFTKDGRILDVTLCVAVYSGRDGNIAGSIHILRDITERRKAEDALLKSHDELERRVEERTAKLARTADQLAMEIAERKRSQERLERYAAELERSNEALEKFAYVASHDLQEPLRTVITYLRMLQRICTGQPGEEADEYIAYAVDGANRMSRLIDSLLKYSLVKGGKPEEPS
jgi:PAS domain S-box-containing protein